MKIIYKAPENIEGIHFDRQTLFLAGSIEMDKAVNWQKECEEKLKNHYIVFNPRRDNWDSSWEQKIENPEFRQQVEWELDALEKADVILMYFAGATYSPISLLELGLFAKSGKLKVVVDELFWRKGNIDVVCQKYKVEQFNSLETLINHLLTQK